jgi:hypothetical protein
MDFTGQFQDTFGSSGFAGINVGEDTNVSV